MITDEWIDDSYSFRSFHHDAEFWSLQLDKQRIFKSQTV